MFELLIYQELSENINFSLKICVEKSIQNPSLKFYRQNEINLAIQI